MARHAIRFNKASGHLEFTKTVEELRQSHIHLLDFNRSSEFARNISRARGIVIGPPLSESVNQNGIINYLGIWARKM